MIVAMAIAFLLSKAWPRPARQLESRLVTCRHTPPRQADPVTLNAMENATPPPEWDSQNSSTGMSSNYCAGSRRPADCWQYGHTRMSQLVHERQHSRRVFSKAISSSKCRSGENLPVPYRWSIHFSRNSVRNRRSGETSVRPSGILLLPVPCRDGPRRDHQFQPRSWPSAKVSGQSPS